MDRATDQSSDRERGVHVDHKQCDRSAPTDPERGVVCRVHVESADLDRLQELRLPDDQLWWCGGEKVLEQGAGKGRGIYKYGYTCKQEQEPNKIQTKNECAIAPNITLITK